MITLAYIRHAPGKVDLLHVDDKGQYVLLKTRNWLPDDRSILPQLEARVLYDTMTPLRAFSNPEAGKRLPGGESISSGDVPQEGE